MDCYRHVYMVLACMCYYFVAVELARIAKINIYVKELLKRLVLILSVPGWWRLAGHCFLDKITVLFLNLDTRTVVLFWKRLLAKGLGHRCGFLPLVLIRLTQRARCDGHSLVLVSHWPDSNSLSRAHRL